MRQVDEEKGVRHHGNSHASSFVSAFMRNLKQPKSSRTKFVASIVVASMVFMVVHDAFTGPLDLQDISLTRALQSTPIVVSVVGDSITTWASSPSMTYAAQMGRLLGPGFLVHNHGSSGKTVMNDGMCGKGPSGKGRTCLSVSEAPACSGSCSYWTTPEFVNATTCDPDIVTIMMGTNDAKGCNWYRPGSDGATDRADQFAEEYRKLIGVFKALPSNPRVFVALPPPGIALCDATGPAGSDDVCLAYNVSYHVVNEVFPALQRQIAEEAGADGVIDVWTAFNGTDVPKSATIDGTHPTDAYQGLIAQTIADVIGSIQTSRKRA